MLASRAALPVGQEVAEQSMPNVEQAAAGGAPTLPIVQAETVVRRSHAFQQ